MFRLFLLHKLSKETSPKQPQLPPKQYKNRRLYERFEVNHKHLALMNEQDILVIRDMSTSGISCEVGERCFERLKVGDTYEARIRYAREVFEVRIHVAWKHKSFVGFAILEPSRQVQTFINRIITPARIGSSLRTLDASLQKVAFDVHPLQFHGEDQTRLVVWENAVHVEAWYFEHQETYAQWDLEKGFESGKLLDKESKTLAKPWEKHKKADSKANPQVKQFCLDIFMVLDYPRAKDLIESLSSS